MSTQIQKLIDQGPVLTDGSWGTQMQKRGLKRGECPDSWNLSRPDDVEDVARQYVTAGSRIILTNTFNGNRFVLGKFKLADKVKELNQAGVNISRKAAGDQALVLASIGPSGKMLFTKEVTETDLASAFAEQTHALAEAGADGLLVETMMDVNEARIAATEAKKTGLPVIVSLVFDSGKNKDRTMVGQTPEQAVEALSKIGLDGIGANCGQGIEGFIPICRRMRAVTSLPLWMKPNAGMPEMVDTEMVYTTSPVEFVKFVPDLLAAGANFIGGCCGTNRDFIMEISRVLKNQAGPKA